MKKKHFDVRNASQHIVEMIGRLVKDLEQSDGMLCVTNLGRAYSRLVCDSEAVEKCFQTGDELGKRKAFIRLSRKACRILKAIHDNEKG